MELGGVNLWDEPESLAVVYLTESAMRPTTTSKVWVAVPTSHGKT